ncbi:hypothetical protein R3P38DRAFT_907099 [Favolaschia claudopus]|uniref:Uncharacterized protein n=1 Tax=Favolaschia claudopus TaxID=2862362 RepID=A0AAV9Z063_9AGAR
MESARHFRLEDRFNEISKAIEKRSHRRLNAPRSFHPESPPLPSLQTTVHTHPPPNFKRSYLVPTRTLDIDIDTLPRFPPLLPASASASAFQVLILVFSFLSSSLSCLCFPAHDPSLAHDPAIAHTRRTAPRSLPPTTKHLLKTQDAEDSESDSHSAAAALKPKPRLRWRLRQLRSLRGQRRGREGDDGDGSMGHWVVVEGGRKEVEEWEADAGMQQDAVGVFPVDGKGDDAPVVGAVCGRGGGGWVGYRKWVEAGERAMLRVVVVVVAGRKREAHPVSLTLRSHSP